MKVERSHVIHIFFSISLFALLFNRSSEIQRLVSILHTAIWHDYQIGIECQPLRTDAVKLYMDRELFNIILRSIIY